MSVELPKIDPRIVRSRQMLFQAFQSLLMEKAFDLISVQDITERSTLNRATFYDHFTDKFGLMEAMIGERFRAMIAARLEGAEMAEGEGCEGPLRQLILGACEFLAEVSSGCQKHQRQFQPMVESQVKAILRELLLERLRSQRVANPELKATMIGWAIAGAALQWSGEKKTSADKLADAILPTVHTALRAGE